MQRIVLIPAYEPDNNLIELVNRLSKENLSIIIVDDGSGEKYNYIFDSLKDKVRIISYKNNKGKGYALKTGFKYIKEEYKNNYIVVTMDSDGQHTVEDAIKLCDYIENNSDKLVLGKRLRNKKTPFRSRIGNEITKVVYHISTGINIYDTQTGLRSFSDKLMDTMLEIDGDRYEYEMNVLLSLAKMKIDIKEIEIESIYIDNNSKSHFNTVKDAIRIYKQILKFSLSSITSFFLDYVLYSILVFSTQNIFISNILARIVSGTANYSMNKKLVFNNKGNIYKSAVQYIFLAVFILILNTCILNILVSNLNINQYIAKILVEIMLFIISWLVQKYYIFNKKGEKRKCLEKLVLE